MRLVADIGATNARFCLSEAGTLLSDGWSGQTSHYDQATALLEAACASLGVQGESLESAVLAVAGPLHENRLELTNTGLVFDQTACTDTLQCPTRLVNDFYALASGVPYLTELTQIGGVASSAPTKVVLGPGSGLGMATLAWLRDAWHVIPGEGGHADLAPGNHLESELWSVLTAQFGQVSWERVLSGPGLINLYGAMCATWGSPAEDLSAGEITERGVAMTDLVCHQTLETFAGLLGAVAGNMALSTGALGGVYIGGGIAPRLLEFLQASPMRRRFEEKGQMSAYVKPIPIYVIEDVQAGLRGANACFDDER